MGIGGGATAPMRSAIPAVGCGVSVNVSVGLSSSSSMRSDPPSMANAARSAAKRRFAFLLNDSSRFASHQWDSSSTPSSTACRMSASVEGVQRGASGVTNTIYAP
jgi:hypothetical protein